MAALTVALSANYHVGDAQCGGAVKGGKSKAHDPVDGARTGAAIVHSALSEALGALWRNVV